MPIRGWKNTHEMNVPHNTGAARNKASEFPRNTHINSAAIAIQKMKLYGFARVLAVSSGFFEEDTISSSVMPPSIPSRIDGLFGNIEQKLPADTLLLEDSCSLAGKSQMRKNIQLETCANRFFIHRHDVTRNGIAGI